MNRNCCLPKTLVLQVLPATTLTTSNLCLSESPFAGCLRRFFFGVPLKLPLLELFLSGHSRIQGSFFCADFWELPATPRLLALGSKPSTSQGSPSRSGDRPGVWPNRADPTRELRVKRAQPDCWARNDPSSWIEPLLGQD